MKKFLSLSFVLVALFAAVLMTVGAEAKTIDVSTAKELSNAFSSLSKDGGTVNLTADITIDSATSLPANVMPIVLTSSTHKKIQLSNNLAFNGDVEISDIHFQAKEKYRSIFCNGHTVSIASDVTCGMDSGTNYPSIMAGFASESTVKNGSLTISGGIWQRVRGGNASEYPARIHSELIINGGTFKEKVTIGSAGAMASGSVVTATINGGVFERGVVCFTPGDNTLYADCTLTINGGAFTGWVKVYEEDDSANRLNGKCTIRINGGDFSKCTGIRGYDGSTMDVDIRLSSVLLTNGAGSLKKTDYLPGTLLRKSSADPWMFEYNGCYYLTVTGSTRVLLYKSRTISGLSSMTNSLASDYEEIYQFDASLCADLGIKQCAGTWSPEVHYYSEEDFPGNSGWYLNLALNTGTNTSGGSVNVKMVVLKSVSGEPEGPYGHPITGVINDPIMVVYDKDGTGKGVPYSEWACGQTSMRIPSGDYKGIWALWVEETGRGTADFYQSIMTAKMSNPWTFTGKIGVVTTPTQRWEAIGSGYSGTKWMPKVVEGATPVYGKNGELYLTYSGSGYWTNYGLGQLTYTGGDPTKTSSWVKYENNPIFSAGDADGKHRSGVDLQGVGHASFFTDSLGNGYICYHAYPYNSSSKTKTVSGVTLAPGKKGSARNAYVESYYIDYTLSNGYSMGVIRVGKGNDAPAPLGNMQSFKMDTSPANLPNRMVGAYTTFTTDGFYALPVEGGAAGKEIYINGKKSEDVGCSGNYLLLPDSLSDAVIEVRGNGTVSVYGCRDGHAEALFSLKQNEAQFQSESCVLETELVHTSDAVIFAEYGTLVSFEGQKPPFFELPLAHSLHAAKSRAYLSGKFDYYTSRTGNKTVYNARIINLASDSKDSITAASYALFDYNGKRYIAYTQ